MYAPGTHGWRHAQDIAMLYSLAGVHAANEAWRQYVERRAWHQLPIKVWELNAMRETVAYLRNQS